MPELPEVETTCNGIRPHCVGHEIADTIVRNPNLRWPIPSDLVNRLAGQQICAITRRAKYILMKLEHGSLIIHLGMSGRLHIVPHDCPPAKHDHVDMIFRNGQALRYHDPRRFGSMHWTENPREHFLLRNLGVEPLTDDYDSDYLYTQCQRRKVAIKPLLMNHHMVVGIGNIYASEALFLAGVHPEKIASSITPTEAQRIVQYSKDRLEVAIQKGGSTLKDFLHTDGKPGYFQHHFQVYGRANEACYHCSTPIQKIVQAQRATFFCPTCQGA
jgi:formamidopyrimidine-DNA glycosylase